MEKSRNVRLNYRVRASKFDSESASLDLIEYEGLQSISLNVHQKNVLRGQVDYLSSKKVNFTSWKQLNSWMSENVCSFMLLSSLGVEVGMKKSTSGRFATLEFAAWFAPIRFIGEYWFGIGLILRRLLLGWTFRDLKFQKSIGKRFMRILVS